MDRLQSEIEQVKAALDEPTPEPGKRKGARKIMAAKKVKKSKKADKAANGDEGKITISDLATEAKINTQSARVKLREAGVEKPGGRWAWDDGSGSLKKARAALGL